MPHEIIMPALGMAQDTGLIVAWNKAPGDAVAATDVLFVVETDKATMDVEAGHDGFVAELLAEAGQEAPVGEVIAVISAEQPENPIHSNISARAETAKAPAPTAPQETPDTAVEPTQNTGPANTANKKALASTAPEGPILASPKARRLAVEQGLDLARRAAHLNLAGIPDCHFIGVAFNDFHIVFNEHGGDARLSPGLEMVFFEAEVDVGVHEAGQHGRPLNVDDLGALG